MNKLLNIYFTAGYPEINATAQILLDLQKSGVDMIEIGLPYSDPLADGPTIQASGQKALDNGMNTNLLFEQLASIKDQIKIPVYLMGYYNQWYQYGLETFCQKCKEVGVAGLIMPDLPLDYFDDKHKTILAENGLKICFLITPDTAENRIDTIGASSTGLVYIFSNSSTTGKKEDISKAQLAYFERIKSYKFQSKKLIGFGIHDNQTFSTACEYADGAIIGSAFVNHIKDDYSFENIERFVNSVRVGELVTKIK